MVRKEMIHIATTEQPEKRNLNRVREVFYDDMDYTLAVWLDNSSIKCRMAREEFVSYLSIPSDKTRPCVRSTATAYLKALGSENVSKTLSHTSFSLQDLMDGKRAQQGRRASYLRDKAFAGQFDANQRFVKRGRGHEPGV